MRSFLLMGKIPVRRGSNDETIHRTHSCSAYTLGISDENEDPTPDWHIIDKRTMQQRNR